MRKGFIGIILLVYALVLFDRMSVEPMHATMSVWVSRLAIILGALNFLRVPYLLFFASSVTGYETVDERKGIELVDIGRGTTTFWIHCIPHVLLSAFAVYGCYLVLNPI